MNPHPPFFFDSWYLMGRTATLTVLGFAAMIIMLRVSGKRTLSKMNVFDFVFVVAVGSVMAATIVEKDVTLLEGMMSLSLLIGIQIVLAKIAAYSKTAEKIINGEPALLLAKGQFIERALKKERVTKEEVRAAIRDKGVNRVEDVDAVILENDGTLTVTWEARGPGHSALVDAKDPEGRKPASKGS
jgi:uncharacterized membrane protein YcaP (DUF421 family)